MLFVPRGREFKLRLLALPLLRLLVLNGVAPWKKVTKPVAFVGERLAVNERLLK